MVSGYELLRKIAEMQARGDDPRFAAGMFASERRHPHFGFSRPDDNIFFPALIDFTLSGLRDRMTPEEWTIAKGIIAGIRPNYAAYESLRAPGLYNFYRTNPPTPYPNGHFLRRFQHFRLAEDADDTALISAVTDDLPPERVAFLREELRRFSNVDGERMHHPLPGYTGIPAHGIWFGTGAMPVEVDVCVLCNVLCFSARHADEFDATDRSSLAFIRRAIETGDIDRHSFVMSYSYSGAPVIWYHIARLWAELPEPERWLPRDEIVAGMEACLLRTEGQMPRLLVESALLKMGARPQVRGMDEGALEAEALSFPFFVAPMLAGTRLGLLNKLAARRVFQLDFICPAHNYTLLLERLLLERGEPSP